MSEAGSARIHSMDALRASTMMLLVPVHAAGLLAVNGHPGEWATAIYWFVHIFRLPLFFAMSGFFLALLLTRKGLGLTARNRTVRIAVPLAIGLVTLVPALILAADASEVAIVGGGQGNPDPLSLEPSFLWFLWYLLIVDGAAIAAHLLVPNVLRTAGRWLRNRIARPLDGLPVLAVATALVLWPGAHWVAASPTDSFVPDLPGLLYYAIFFALGATLYTHRELVDGAAANAWRWAGCALVAVVPAAALHTLHNSPVYSTRPMIELAALLTYAIATWCSLLALVGLASRYLRRDRPSLRYLADSSYWIYLSHLPAMVLLVAAAGTTALGTGPQFLLVTVGSLAFSLATYPLFVRYTTIGRLLNGPRQRPRRRLRPALRTPA
jgi:glucans biosynthesis protein C